MISRLQVKGFRGVVGELDLEMGQITLLSGRNGFGKTTIFDAIDWCLFGESWRLGGEGQSQSAFGSEDTTRNIYVSSLEPAVALTLDMNGERCSVERNKDGVSLNGNRIRDRELLERFILDDSLIPPYAQDLGARIRRLIYLPQEDIRRLLSPAASSERVAMFQSLLGIPNAATVESGLRRVRQRLEERQKELERQLLSVRADIEQILPSAAAEAQRDVGVIETVLDQARQAVGLATDQIASLEALREVCDGELQKAAARRLRLDSAKARTVTLAEARRTAKGENERYQAAVEELDRVIAREDEATREATARVALTVDRQLMGIRKVATLRAEVDNTRRLLARIDAVTQARARAREARETEAQARASVAAAETTVSLARQELGERERNAGLLRQQSLELRGRREHFDKRRRLEERREILEGRVSELTAQLQIETRRRQEVLTERERAREELARAERDFEGEVARAAKLDQIRTLVARVGELIGSYSESTCPLCGQWYESIPELRSHVQRTTGDRETRDSTLRELRDRAAAAREIADSKSAEAADVARAVVELETLVSEMGAELRLVRGTLESDSDREAALPEEDLDRLTAAVEAAEQERDAAERRVREGEARLEEQTQQLRRIVEDIQVLESRVLAYENEVAAIADGSTPTLDALRETLSLKEEELQSAVREVEQAEQEKGEAEAAEDASRHRLVDARERRAKAEERLAAAGTRVLKLEEEMNRLLAGELVGRVLGDDDLEAELEARLADARGREDSLRQALAACDEAIARRARDQASSALAALRRVEEDVVERRKQVERASRRLEDISYRIQTRLHVEAQLALEQQKSTIQECFAALYPHTHLNAIDLVPTSGEILVSDTLLQNPVPAHLYASTGQMNALALAVFLGVGLKQRVTSWTMLCLDEPVQNLDDIRFLAFITLVKRVAWSRQVILSTADGNVAEILRRQMRSSWGWAERKFIEYQWLGFDPERGPEVMRLEAVKSARKIAM